MSRALANPAPSASLGAHKRCGLSPQVTDLRHPGVVALILLLLLPGATGGAQAAGGVECLKTQCEGKGRSCVQTLHAQHATCQKAARKKCNAVQLAEKFNCLKAELTPCAQTRNQQQQACLTEVRSCHASCGPFEGKAPNYWCVGEFDNGATGAFCTADMTSERPMEACEKVIVTGGEGPFGAMTCDPL